MEKYALLSVSDKSGLLDFARGLTSSGIKILSTGGTASHLKENGIEIVSISDYTESPEVMDGRVKTLHPRVHAGILARRDVAEDLSQLKELGGQLIDFVVVNLYPFREKRKELESVDELIEFIDIGGPTLLRAAAKNHKYVCTVCKPSDYDLVLKQLESNGEVELGTRRRLAHEVFKHTFTYDLEIANFLSVNTEEEKTQDGDIALPGTLGLCLEKDRELRYGENPHQQAGLYTLHGPLNTFSEWSGGKPSESPYWEQLQGKELSYNNLVDMHAAISILADISDLADSAAVVIKHCNPCGAAVSASLSDAFSKAKAGDPVSIFGGIVSLKGLVDKDIAGALLEQFLEIVLFEEASEEALEIFRTKKNLRVIRCNFENIFSELKNPRLEIKGVLGKALVQTADLSDGFLASSSEIVSQGDGSEVKELDVNLSWRICQHVKSNTIVIAKDGSIIGVGAGQMSRVDSAKIAIARGIEHKHSIEGAVAASDAFLPFPDTLEILAEKGIKCLVQPGGSVKDSKVIAAAKNLGVKMLFTGKRHFNH